MNAALQSRNTKRRRYVARSVAASIRFVVTQMRFPVRQRLKYGMRQIRCDTEAGCIVYLAPGGCRVYYFNPDKPWMP